MRYSFKKYLMRKIKILFLLFGMAQAVLAQNAKRVSPTIEHVSVFLNQAEITASVATSLQAGSTKIIIENIANAIDANSIQIKGKGDFTLLGVKYSADHLNAKMSRLEDSIKLVKTEIENLEMLLAVANNEEKMIMANASIKNEKDGVLPEDLKEMIDFFRTKLTEVGARRLQITRQMEPLKDKKNRLEKQLNENIDIRMPLGQIELSVSASKPTSAQLVVVYRAFNAGWTPSYDIRVKDTKSPVMVAYKAGVYQNTGLDWKNVKLTLSTSNPQLSGVKPELFPQYLSIYESAPVYKNARMATGQTLEMASDAMMATAPAEMHTSAMLTQRVETALSVQFDIALPYSIPTGGNPEMVEIQNNSVAAQFVNMITPKLETAGFLMAKISDWEKYKFISGQANVYFEDKYIGQTFLNELNVKDDLEISLGRDAWLIGKREDIANFKARKSIGSNIKESFGYTISVRNAKNQAVDLTVEDQVPVSQDSSIEVETEELSGGELDGNTGKVKWILRLEPNQSKNLELKYTVKYPKEKKINNL
jgi:uncharacterized protein (TIGR02231 family)